MRKILLFAMSLSPALVNAQAFATGYAGDKQHAMGNAGSALALDAASMNFNPATLSFLSGSSVSIGGAVAVANTAFLDANNNSISESSSPIGTPFHVNVAYRVKDTASALSKFTFGLGIGTPYGGNIKYDADWTGKYVIIEKSLGSLALTPTVSYKISDKLSAGASFAYSESKLHVLNGVPVDSTATVEMDYSSRGMGFGAGLYFQLNEDISLGLGYSSQVNTKSYKGTVKFTVPSSIDNLFPSGDATFNSSVPQIISLGAGYTGIEKLTLAVDVNYSLWSCYDSTIFDYTAATATSAVSSTRLPAMFEDVFSFRLGAQYDIIDNLTGRLGVSYEMTPVPTDYVYADLPDADRLNITAGVSYNISEAFSLDLSYRFSNVMKKESTNHHTGMSGTYKTLAHVTGLSLNYNF